MANRFSFKNYKWVIISILSLLVVWLYFNHSFLSVTKTRTTELKSEVHIKEEYNNLPRTNEDSSSLSDNSNELATITLEKLLDKDDLYSYALELIELLDLSQGEAEYLIYHIALYCSVSDIETGSSISDFYKSLGVALNMQHFDFVERRKTQCSAFNASSDKRLTSRSIDDWLFMSFQQKSQRGIFEYVANHLDELESKARDKKIDYFSKHFKAVIMESLENTSHFNYQSFGQIISSLGDTTSGHALMLLSCSKGSDCSSHSKAIWRTKAFSLCLGITRNTDCFTTTDITYLMNLRHSKLEYNQFLVRSKVIESQIEQTSLKQFISEQIELLRVNQ